MRIRKLEMMGFKSFPERTVLQFGDGVSCIVGPNGCGKSNIIDALRWCIGEQSAKKLRGGEMMDVIFAGSKERKAVGFAEVSMTLAVDGGEPFPGDYSQFEQISVGRRLHRTGQSEYFVNQTNVRRRDIVDLFLDTGIGNNLYSFIEQGRIGEIVQARPEHRRGLIDEAAGIAKYKIRRDEAQKRLESTATQLDRAADVADEMGRRLRTLARQVLKAAAFRRSRALIRQNELFLSLAKYANLAADRRALRETLREHRIDLGRVERDIVRRTAELDERRSELKVVEDGAESLRDEVAEADASIREKQGERGFWTQRKAEWDARIERLASDLGEATSDRDQGIQNGRLVEGSLDDLKVSETVLCDTQNEQEQALKGVTALLETATERARNSQDGYLAEKARREALEAQRRADVERVHSLPGLIEETRNLASNITLQMAAGLGEVDSFDTLLKEGEQEQMSLSKSLEAARQKRQILVNALRGVQSEREQIRTALADRRRSVQEERNARVQSGVEAQENERFVRENQQKERRIWLKSVVEESRERVALVRDDAQSTLDERMERLQQWIDAKRQYGFESNRRLVDTHRKQVSILEAEWDVRLATLRETAENERDAHSDKLSRQFEADSGLLQNRLDEETARVSQLRKEMKLLEGQHREQNEVLVHAGARLAALEEMETEGQMSDEEMRTVLHTWETVLSQLGKEGQDVPIRLLNDRVGLPIIDDEKSLVALAKLAANSGACRVLWSVKGKGTYEVCLDRIAVVACFEDAVRLHKKTGGAVVVESTGDRIYADGVVELGQQGRGGRAQQESEATKQALRNSVEGSRAAVADIMRRWEALSAECEERQARIETERERLGALSTSLSDAMKDLRRKAEGDLKGALDRHKTDRQATFEDFSRKMQDAEGALKRAFEADWGKVETMRRQVVHQINDIAHRRTEEVESVEDARLRSAELQAEQRSAELLSQAEQTVVRAVRDLEEWERGVQETLLAMEVQLEEKREAAQAGRSDLNSASERVAQSEGLLLEKRVYLGSTQNSKKALMQQVEQMRLRRDEVGQRLKELQDELVRAETSKDNPDESDNLQKALEVLSEVALQDRVELDAAELKMSTVKDDIALVRVELATLRERRVSLEQQRRAAKQAAQRGAERLATVAEEEMQLRVKVKEGATRAEGLEAELSAQIVARTELWDKLQAERERLTVLKTAKESARIDLREVEERRNRAQILVAEQEGQILEAKGTIDGLKQRMDERYQVSLPGQLDRLEAQSKLEIAPPQAAAQAVEVEGKTIEAVEPLIIRASWLSDEERIQRRVVELEKQREVLSRIGEVNLTALEEYEDVRERHRDLEAQRADLETSIQRIRAAIAKMNRTCREQFRETFDLVNEAFQEMYPTLVGGGRARLSLTNEDDLLETGVDIFVQPPGKRLQNLNLLSGGEKAMAAIALIMALFRVKPSPFCVLDEVDAPLDEGNGSRFNAAIRQMARHSQFILVTHNRKTMECADTLVGITMPVPGVSRLVSVQLDA